MLSALHFNLTLSSVLVDSISVAVSRRVLSHVVTQLKTLPGQMSLELCIPLLNTLRPRMISFEEQVILKVNVSMRNSCLVMLSMWINNSKMFYYKWCFKMLYFNWSYSDDRAAPTCGFTL